MTSNAALLLERVRAATADEYTIEKELGRGGMAAVFLAKDIALDRRVAIKVMLPDLVDVEGIQDRFVIEAKTAAHLDHPGIVTVYSVKQRGGLLFIVMKFIEGRTLENLLKVAGPLNPHVAMTIVKQVAEALQFAHSEGVVHRDVKPSNIIIDTRGRPVVTDFGIAKVMAQKSITVTGSMLGTPTYMSPEQCRGLPATVASDQYSLGVMAYEMLSGKVPFNGTIYELIHAHCTEPPPPLTTPGLDKGIEETVMRMLAKNPPERWESLTEVSRRISGTMPANSKSDEMQAVIAGFVRGNKTQIGRSAQTMELSSQATQLATTPVNTTPAPGLVVTPEAPSIEIGQSLQMRVSQASGASLAGVKITWQSEDPTIATVDDTGTVTGRAVGLAKITVTGGSSVGRVAVNVRASTANTIAVTPQNPVIVTEAEVQFVATVLDARGNTIAGQTIFWQSSNPAVCAISGKGLAIGMSPGAATITATVGDITGSANAKVKAPAVERVVVEPGEFSIEAEESCHLVASAYAANERKLAGRSITWRSTVPTVAAVDAQGNVKGITPGTAAIIATCDGKDGIASVSVRSQPVVAVRIQPAQLQLEVGRSLQLKGTGEDRRGRAVGEKIEWHSDNDQIALVDASGKVHAVHEGHTIVRATVGDATSTIAVTIIPRAAASIRIEAHKPTLDVGEFISLDAIVLDAEGSVLTGREIRWTTTDSAIVSVDNEGNCEAKRPGAARLTASCERARASTKLSVAAAAPIASAPAVPPRDAARDAETQKLEVVGLPPAGAGASPRAQQPPPAAAPRAEPKVPPSVAAPVQRKSKLLPAAAAIAVLVIAGAWFALKGGGSTPPAPVATSPEVVPTPPPDTKVAVAPPVDTQVTTPPPDTPPPETKAAEPPPPPVTQSGRANTSTQNSTARANTPPRTNTARGNTPPRTDSSGASRGTNPPASTTNPPGSTTNPPATGTNPPVSAAVPPPATANPPATPPVSSNPPASGTPPPEEPNAMCTNAALPTGALSSQLTGNLANVVTQLYQPRDANDRKQKDNMLKDIKGMNNAKAAVRAVRADAVGGGCDWIMVIDFTGVSFVGAQRRSTWQAKVQLEGSAGSPRVKNLFSATKQ